MRLIRVLGTPCGADWICHQAKVVHEKFSSFCCLLSIDSSLIFAFFWSLFSAFKWLIFVFFPSQFIVVICGSFDLVGAYSVIPEAEVSLFPFLCREIPFMIQLPAVDTSFLYHVLIS